MIEVAKAAVQKHVDNHEDYLPGEYYPDSDGHGFGEADAEAITACVQPDRTSDNNLDCNDEDPTINPEAEDACSDPNGVGGDGIDNDCDGEVDEGTEEICNDSIDNDCDGVIDEPDDCIG